MAKVVSVYLSTEETKELDRLCEEYSVTPYKLLRLAFQVLCKETEERKRSKQPAQSQKPRSEEKPNLLGQLTELPKSEPQKRSVQKTALKKLLEEL